MIYSGSATGVEPYLIATVGLLLLWSVIIGVLPAFFRTHESSKLLVVRLPTNDNSPMPPAHPGRPRRITAMALIRRLRGSA